SFHVPQRLGSDVVNEYASDNQFRKRSERRDSKREVMNDFYFNARRHSLKSPDHLHSLGPRLQMSEANLTMLPVNDLFRCPGNRKKTSVGRHSYHIAERIFLVIMNVSIVRKKSWPALEVCGRLENRLFRGVHYYRVCAVHSA